MSVKGGMWGVLFAGRPALGSLADDMLFSLLPLLFKLVILSLFYFCFYFVLFMAYFLVASCARASRDNGSHRPDMSHGGVALVSRPGCGWKAAGFRGATRDAAVLARTVHCMYVCTSHGVGVGDRGSTTANVSALATAG